MHLFSKFELGPKNKLFFDFSAMARNESRLLKSNKEMINYVRERQEQFEAGEAIVVVTGGGLLNSVLPVHQNYLQWCTNKLPIIRQESTGAPWEKKKVGIFLDKVLYPIRVVLHPPMCKSDMFYTKKEWSTNHNISSTSRAI